MDILAQVLLFFFSQNIVCTVLWSVFLVLFLNCSKTSGCSCFNYVLWFIMGFLSFIGFAIAILMIVISVLGIASCGVMGQMLTDQLYFQQFNKIFGFRISDQASTCLYGDGDLPQMFDYQNQFDSVDKLKANFANLQSFEKDINSNVFLVTNLIDRTNDELLFPEKSYTNPANNEKLCQSLLNDINLYSDNSVGGNYQTGCDQSLNDQLIFTQASCTDINTYPVVETTTQIPPTVVPNDKYCMVLDASLESQYQLNRIDQIKNCAQADYTSLFSTSYTKLAAYKTDQQRALQALLSNLQTQLDLDIKLRESYNTLYQQVNSGYTSAMDGLDKNLQDQNSGILQNMNCQFIQYRFIELHGAMCKNLMVNIYNSSILFLVMVIFMFFANCFIFFDTTRLSYWVEQKNNILKGDQQKIELDDSQSNLEMSMMNQNHPSYNRPLYQNQMNNYGETPTQGADFSGYKQNQNAYQQQQQQPMPIPQTPLHNQGYYRPNPLYDKQPQSKNGNRKY